MIAGYRARRLSIVCAARASNLCEASHKFDTLAAQTVPKLKPSYPNIKLILVLPCLTQTRGWRPEDIAEYERIKSLADKVVYTAQQYTRGCMHKRNRHLVDNSSVCVCYLNRESGGTAYTVDYAEKRGLEVINLAIQ